MIELFSIHIPKTAGRSLLHVLNKVYGDENVLVINRKLFKSDPAIALDEIRSKIKPHTKVIHGHIYISEILPLIEENPQARIITFLREPVERVISHFHYEKKILEEKGHLSGNKNIPVDTMLSYARHEDARNIIYKFLNGIALDKFFFTGNFLNFETDLLRLGKLMKWPAVPVPQLNSNESTEKLTEPVSSDVKNEIRKLNELDEEIFNAISNSKKHRIRCWVASFPRSGNTFFRNILYYVYGIESGTWHKESAFRVDHDYDQYSFVKTHLLPDELIPEDPSIPAIYIVRDGRDAMVSIAHHRSDLVFPGSDLIENMKEAVVAAEGSFFGGWSKNVNAWIERATIVVRYEDLITDPKKVFERVEKVIELPAADWNKLPSFEELKSGKAKYGSGTKNPNPKFNPDEFATKFFRKGKSGGWKEEMPVYLQDLFRNYHGEIMERTGYLTDVELTGQNRVLDFKAMGKMGLMTPDKKPKQIKILIEASKLAHPGNDGIKRYLVHLLKGFEDVKKHGEPKWIFELLIGRKFYPLESYRDVINIEEIENLHTYEKVLLGFKAAVRSVMPDTVYTKVSAIYRKTDARRLLRKIQQKTSIKQKLAFYEELDSLKHEVDLLHVPLPQNSEHFKTLSHKFLVTVHDLTHRLFPQFHEQANIQLAEEGMGFIVDKNADVIVVSDCTENDLIKYYPVAKNKIHRIYEAPDNELFKWNMNSENAERIRSKYNLGKDPYFLCLSTIEPRKNLPNTIRAFNDFIAENPNSRVNLVISGNFGWKTEHLNRELHLDNERIIFTGYVDDMDLDIVYSEALALCYISVYEGFGLPLLEAMSCRTPVIYGDNSSMKEIIGDAGLPARADDVNSIRIQIGKMFSDKILRDKLAVAAHYKSFEFTRRKSIYETLKLYEQLTDVQNVE